MFDEFISRSEEKRRIKRNIWITMFELTVSDLYIETVTVIVSSYFYHNICQSNFRILNKIYLISYIIYVNG